MSKFPSRPPKASYVDKGDPESQRKRFEEQLRNENYECMVCVDEIRARASVWSCSNCYNIFHLKCIKTWAQSNTNTEQQSQPGPTTSNGGNGWRCPACQNVMNRIPERYYCFCERKQNPPMSHNPTTGIVPHSCGRQCNRQKNCAHPCPIKCHPGACPPCSVTIRKSCFCGNSSLKIACGEPSKTVHCSKPCAKKMPCGVHLCWQLCHSDECLPCGQKVDQVCHCARQKRAVDCTAEVKGKIFYSCQEQCNKPLSCGHHNCHEPCHQGPCKPCPLSPSVVNSCPCGKFLLSELPKAFVRKSCTDRIPCCGKPCDRELSCGPPEEPHKCPKNCHNAFSPTFCKPCQLKTVLRCGCGANSMSLDCVELVANPQLRDFKCKKRCQKKLSCGRHKCIEECCTILEHECSQPCGKKLACQSHNCADPCHRGPCGPCWNVSWDELTCACGAEIKLPPINCGTQPPPCDKICSRHHPCGHAPDHKCHSEPVCPPCTVMVGKMCYGGHQQITSVLCYMTGVSCGKRCGKKMACGLHICQRVCHDDTCGDCTYPCPIKRTACDHACAVVCHASTSPQSCPPSKCRISLKVHCACHRKTDQMPCFQVNDCANRIPTSLMAKLRIQSDIDLDVSSLISKAKENKLCRLECDATCSLLERNKKLAQALDVKEADLSPQPGAPNYPESLKQYTIENMDFIDAVYSQLTALVSEAKRSRMAFKNHNFPPMRADQRHAIHELAEFFGCKSHGVDQEPIRSVVVKAVGDKSFIPTVSLMDVVRKKQGWLVLSQKGPPARRLENNKFSTATSNSSNATAATTKIEPKEAWKTRRPEPTVDYFDFNGDD